MLVSQLPESLKELAKLRAREQNLPEDEDRSLNGAFDWRLTSEGRDFWKEIYVGNFNVYPHSVGIKKYKTLTIKLNNDLWKI